MKPTIEDAGFCLQDTGGNCTAWERTFESASHLWEALITEVNDPTAPEMLDGQVVRLSLFVDGIALAESTDCSNVREVVATLAVMLVTSSFFGEEQRIAEVWPDWYEMFDENHVRDFDGCVGSIDKTVTPESLLAEMIDVIEEEKRERRYAEGVM